jgi:hypothetical protein
LPPQEVEITTSNLKGGLKDFLIKMKKQSLAIQNDRKDKRASLISTLNNDEI